MSHLPQRIASLQPSATLVVAELGALHRLVACTKYCADVCPAIAESKAAIIHDSWTADASQILATRPDLVLASVPYQEKALAEILKAGVPVLALAPHSLRDVYADIALIAGVVGEADRGERMIERMQSEIAQISKRAAQAGACPRVFCEEWGKPIIASQPWVAELVCFAGGDFLGSPGKQIAADEVRDSAPEVIVAAWCGAGDRVPLEKIIRERGWSETPAARSGRVFCVRDELLNTPAPSLIGGLKALAWACHPELFPPSDGIRQIGTEIGNGMVD